MRQHWCTVNWRGIQVEWMVRRIGGDGGIDIYIDVAFGKDLGIEIAFKEK
jgi:hypothetical protein